MLTQDEYEKRFKDNYRVEGFGFDGMTIHSPCPFCAAPDFHVYKLDTMMSVTSKETVCAECKRGFRIEYAEHGNTTTGRLLQTCGDPAPPYIPIARPRERVYIEKDGDHGD
jgi:hypothetical protein